MAGSRPPKHEDACMPSRRQGAPPPALHCSAAATMPARAACAPLAPAALPHHTLQQRCLCQIAYSASTVHTYVDCVWCVRHTHTPSWPAPRRLPSGRPCGRCGGAVCCTTPTMQWVLTTCNCVDCFVETYQDRVCSNAFVRAGV